MDLIVCTNCRRHYATEGVPYRCPTCGGSYDLPVLPTYNPKLIERDLPGIWRYRHTFGLPPGAMQVSLGEGNTPLVPGDAFGEQVFYKLEYSNPSGSFKDRGSAVLCSFLKSRGISSAVEDSSGNAGASFAAYAVRSNIKASVFVPDSISGPKLRQIEAYGAEIVRVPGSRSDAAEAVCQAAEMGEVYASHAYLPHGLAGYATIAYEIFEQLGSHPGAVITPAGQGGTLLGILRGFESLLRSGAISKMPTMIGVQARACAPLWLVNRYGTAGMSWFSEGQTIAEGVRVRYPIRGDAILQALANHNGFMLAVDEDQILIARDRLARQGFYVEPTSAIVWNGLEQVIEHIAGPVVVILTGSGLKTL